MQNDELNAHYADCQRVDALLRRTEIVMPCTAENTSRDRLMRVKAGICHLLTNVIPNVKDEECQKEMYLWLSGIHSILRFEEADFLKEIKKVIK